MKIIELIKNNKSLSFLKNILLNIKYNLPKISYSQCGEDLIIKHIFDYLGKKNIFYIDIGTNHPKFFNNTYLFYKKGGNGICVEPDPTLFNKIKCTRKRDICLNVGISDNNSKKVLPFYMMSENTLNTFSENRAKELENKNIKIKEIREINILNINDLFDIYIKENKKIDLFSLDIEGLDFDILKNIDFDKYRPLIICVETVDYVGVGLGSKDFKFKDFLNTKEYVLYADTHINSIFVDKRVINL